MLLLKIAFIDTRTFEIPDRLSYSVIGLALLQIPVADADASIDIILGGIIAWFLFEATRRIMARRLGRDALGMGDVKLMIGGGLWVGLSSISAAVLIACLSGMIQFGILAYIYKTPIRDRKIPFGPYLVLGLLVVKIPLTQNILSTFLPF